MSAIREWVVVVGATGAFSSVMVERVFVPGRFYGGNRFYDQGGMKGWRAMLAFSPGGQPHMLGPDAIHGEIDLMRGSLFDVLPLSAAYHVPYISPNAQQQILLDYEQRLLNRDAQKALSFPSMGDFDERLYPKT